MNHQTSVRDQVPAHTYKYREFTCARMSCCHLGRYRLFSDRLGADCSGFSDPAKELADDQMLQPQGRSIGLVLYLFLRKRDSAQKLCARSDLLFLLNCGLIDSLGPRGQSQN